MSSNIAEHVPQDNIWKVDYDEVNV